MAHILIAEDDLLMLKVFQTAFSAEGFEVTTAVDGFELMNRLTEKRPTVVLTDIMMPKLNGLEVIEKMKLDPLLKDIPVIALTNLNANGICEHALEKGAVRCLIKDQYKPKEVVAAVKEIIETTTRNEIPVPKAS